MRLCIIKQVIWNEKIIKYYDVQNNDILLEFAISSEKIAI